MMEFTNDRIGEYLKIFLEEYIFDELSDEYLKKADALDILKGVPVPIHRSDILEMTNVKIAHAMAMVIGCDINFKYKDNYIEYIRKAFGSEFVKPLINEGVELAVAGDTLRACACFRGALLIDPDNFDALYCYARACKDTYENGEGEDFVGNFKAESLDAFEQVTIDAPDFSPGFYYLGYGYLNLGLYQKALLTFNEFISVVEENAPEETGDIPPEVQEEMDIMYQDVREWIKRLQEPVKIEKGYNLVLSGKYPEGIDALLPYVDDPDYREWWPLHYYLGVAYKGLGLYPEALECFSEVLKISPSDIATMSEVAEIYEILGDTEMSEKFLTKIGLVERNMEEERAQRNADCS